MNETEITHFLATKVLEKEVFDKRGDPPFIAIKIDNYWQAFDPIHNIVHAFMVEDGIAKMDVDIVARYSYRLWLELNVPSGRFSADFLLAHASPKQRSIAAVRALASDAQKKEMEID